MRKLREIIRAAVRRSHPRALRRPISFFAACAALEIVEDRRLEAPLGSTCAISRTPRADTRATALRHAGVALICGGTLTVPRCRVVAARQGLLFGPWWLVLPSDMPIRPHQLVTGNAAAQAYRSCRYACHVDVTARTERC